jgi:hypothetical protein
MATTTTVTTPESTLADSALADAAQALAEAEVAISESAPTSESKGKAKGKPTNSMLVSIIDTRYPDRRIWRTDLAYRTTDYTRDDAGTCAYDAAIVDAAVDLELSRWATSRKAILDAGKSIWYQPDYAIRRKLDDMANPALAAQAAQLEKANKADAAAIAAGFADALAMAAAMADMATFVAYVTYRASAQAPDGYAAWHAAQATASA